MFEDSLNDLMDKQFDKKFKAEKEQMTGSEKPKMR